MKKHFTAHVIFAVTAFAGQPAWALGFGRSVSDAVLGQPLAFTVPVHVEGGERLDGACLAARVRYGDSLLPPNAVRTEVLPGASDDTLTLRVTTNVPVSEPIIEISLDIGCDHRFSRLFPVFADPPSLAATPAQVAPSPLAAAAPGLATPSPGTSEATAPGVRRTAPRPAGAVRPRAAHKASTVARPGAAPSAGGSAVADNGGAKKAGAHAPPAAASRPAGESGVPRLKLDMEEPVIPSAASAPGGAAAPGAAVTSAVAPDQGDSLRQLQALQQGLEAARHDILVQREQTAALQAQLARAKAQSQSRGDWTPWLLALLGIAAAAIAALAWKLRQQTRTAHSDWFKQSVLEPATAAPRASELPSEATASAIDPVRPVAAAPAVEPVAGLAPAAADAAPAGAVADHAATRPFDRRVPAAPLPGAPRELSVEELLDLEQQADFFIALGQEDAAVDLLMAHLRSAGGQSPLPYTKLLEIYRRQGDRAAYERTRARFNRRFNAYAPDWDKGPTAGRSLEDYPATIARLEGAWHSPIDAMAMLEALLFKRDDTSELFDLPAYRDVLVLYSLARDLWQYNGGAPGTPVDVLLPLDDGMAVHLVDPRAPSGHGEQADADARRGVRTSFEMTGFGAPPAGPTSERARPAGGSVHATLDELSLSPAAPTRPKPDPRDWRDDGGDSPPRA